MEWMTLERLEQLMQDDGFDINIRDENGKTFLIILLDNIISANEITDDDVLFFDFLLKKGVDINAVDNQYNSALDKILRIYNELVVKSRRFGDKQIRFQIKHMANKIVKDGNFEILAKKGGNFEILAKNNEMIANLAPVIGYSSSTLQELIVASLKLSYFIYSDSILIFAIRKRDLALIRCIVRERNFDFDIMEAIELWPAAFGPLIDLDRFSKSESPRWTLEIIDVLIDNGLDINQKLCAGEYPLMHYIKSCRDFCNGDVVEFLISKGADVSVRDEYGHSLVYIAHIKGFKRIVQILLATGHSFDDFSFAKTTKLKLEEIENARRAEDDYQTSEWQREQDAWDDMHSLDPEMYNHMDDGGYHF
ncbi:MAG: hypothetical protein LBN08_06965 [Lactobacillales bacterium]|jgi:hypothetical protein|nr:hypothetical protein [Lactobacillales bacterium]